MPVNWRGREVMLEVEGMADEQIVRIAFQAEGYAKIGAPVDTGFHRNAIYVIHRGGTSRPPLPSSQWSRKQGRMVERTAAPPVSLPEGVTAALHAAADYAIYIETSHPHIYPAAERAAREAT